MHEGHAYDAYKTRTQYSNAVMQQQAALWIVCMNIACALIGIDDAAATLTCSVKQHA